MWHLGASKMNFRDAHNLFLSWAHALKSIAPCLGAVWVRRCFCTLVPSLRDCLSSVCSDVLAVVSRKRVPLVM